MATDVPAGMPAVLLEVAESGGWARVGSVAEAEPLGSVSSERLNAGDRHRQVYLFGFRGGRPGVWRSVAGVDVATSAFREVAAAALFRLSGLDEPYELSVWRGGAEMRLRFRLFREF